MCQIFDLISSVLSNFLSLLSEFLKLRTIIIHILPWLKDLVHLIFRDIEDCFNFFNILFIAFFNLRLDFIPFWFNIFFNIWVFFIPFLSPFLPSFFKFILPFPTKLAIQFRLRWFWFRFWFFIIFISDYYNHSSRLFFLFFFPFFLPASFLFLFICGLIASTLLQGVVCACRQFWRLFSVGISTF